MVKLTNPENQEIKFEFRQNRILLIFTSFNADSLSEFSDLLEEGCSQIQSVENIIKYDEGIGAIIALMEIGYDKEKACGEIHEVFEFKFPSALTSV